MKKLLKSILTSLAALLLISCGSSLMDFGENKLSAGISSVTKSTGFGIPASPEAIAAMNLKIGSYFNGQYASNPQALMGAQTNVSAQATTSTAAKPVFRFYNSNSGAHFYTMSEPERDYVKQTYPFFSYEGGQFYAYADTDSALSPVYRFYNHITATHFYTINAAEKDHVIATWPEIFNFEGVAWHASKLGGDNWIPVYRFFNNRTGTHFYTASAAEKNHIIATWDWFKFEGIAYYAQMTARPFDKPFESEIAITSALQTGVVEIAAADLSSWIVLTTTADESGATWPTTVSAPSAAVVSEAQVIILGDKAIKVLSVATDLDGKKILTTTRPEAKEIYSSLKIRGKLPLFPFEAQAIPQLSQSSVMRPMRDIFMQAAGSRVEYSRLVSTPGRMQKGNYDPSLGSLADCLNVRLGAPLPSEGEFVGAAEPWPNGVTVELTNCSLKASGNEASSLVGINGVLGIYGSIDFGDVDVLDQVAMSKVQYALYARLHNSFGFVNGPEFSRLWRIWGAKMSIPSAPGLTVAGMLDLIIKAKIEGDVSYASKYDFIAGRDATGKFYANTLKSESGANITANLNVAPQVRFGMGIGVLGAIAASVNPRLGVELDATYDLVTDPCIKFGVYSTVGMDLIAAPNVSYFGDIRKEMSRTLDLGTIRAHTFVTPRDCPTVTPIITRYDPFAQTPFSPDRPVGSTYKPNSGTWASFDLDDGELFSGATSKNATTYLWEVLNVNTVLASANTVKVRIRKNVAFSGVSVAPGLGAAPPVFTVNSGNTIRLTVTKNGGGAKSTSFNIVGNQAPVSSGVAVEKANNQILITPLGSLDTDGRIVRVEWKNTSSKIIAQSTDLSPITIHRDMVLGQKPAQLLLIVYDNDGMAKISTVTESLLPDIAISNITPATATLNTATVFTVTGTNLPPTAILAVADATCLGPVNNPVAGTGFSQTCTPLALGTKTITVKTAPGASGGTVIDATRTVNVIPAVVRFELVQRTGGGYYDLTECVFDNQTGLIWEGKPLTGDRAASRTFNWDFVTGSVLQNQYVPLVNNMSLCGFSDWNVPVISQLQSIIKTGVTPSIDLSWFPNTVAGLYRSNTYVDDGRYSYMVNFANGETVYNNIYQRYARLVRSTRQGAFSVPASLPAGTKFTVPAGVNNCTFTPTGTWTSNTWTGTATGIAGATNPSYTWVMASSPSFSLVGLRESTPFYIGNSASLPVTAGESLYLLMNDAVGNFGDNSGALSVSYSCN